ncbi:uncharacterized protein LOC106164287 [Lingula anatina]|uniref:Autophagy-related protein 27 n=1 Tax=Lingula anatina TaxID=7574 RepID=A0A1S3IIB0_LINAN|nr:uncharacterized protein LOC106164287 [Lingula anatina]|eukprot:XP_013397616.1 uncharacterized protein LOC106164287 [Lingula anatina]
MHPFSIIHPIKVLPLILVLAIRRVSSETCAKIDSCSCKHANGNVDLHPLALSNGKARFENIQATSGTDKFSWNPCKDFTQGSCQNVAACQIQSSGSWWSSYYPIGSQNTAQFTSDGSTNIILTYTNTHYGVTRFTYITLICDSKVDAQLTADGEKSSRRYYMTLKSKYACPGGGSDSGGSGGTGGGSSGGKDDKAAKQGGKDKSEASIGGGSVMMIILVTVIPIYLIGGILTQKFIRHKSGTDVIPNKDFWTDFPFLVRDGVLFVFHKCRPGSTYSNV